MTDEVEPVQEPAAEVEDDLPIVDLEIEDTSVGVWVPAARLPVVTAVEAAGLAVLDEPDGATYAIVSTRLPRPRINEFIERASELGLSIVVLVHPGGEAIGVEALCSGGPIAIAEGDVDALRGLYEAQEPSDERINALLDAYEARLGRAQAALRSTVAMVDPISGLPAAGAFAARLTNGSAEPNQQLRMVAICVSGLAENGRMRLGPEALTLLHRRIAMGVKLLCQPLGELFDNREGHFLLLAPQMSILQVEELARLLAELVTVYMPDGQLPLTVAVGHAGPECSTDLVTLRELAGRAEAAARQEDRSVVLGAGELVRPMAVATDLEVTLKLAELAGELEGATPRRETAAVASDLAHRLGFEGRERVLVRFCAEVSDIGAALSSEPSERAGLASRVLGATAGPVVSAVLETLNECWDGSGTPNGLKGTEIPMVARIVAVAEALVEADYALPTIEAAAGTCFDPTVVSAAIELVKQR